MPPTNDSPDSRDPHAPKGHLPFLSPVEWLIYAILAAALACINIYSTLLIGWGDTGSIIAVLAAALVLGALGRKVSSHTLNLGQTMASAGGSVGFAVAQYAAVKMIDPNFEPPVLGLMALFFALSLLGTVIGASVRKYLIKYYWPSGTACAIIQRAVTGEDAEDAELPEARAGDAPRTTPDRTRPLRLLRNYGTFAALITIPTKINFFKEWLIIKLKGGVASVTAEGAAPLLPELKGHSGALAGQGLSFEAALYGIGIVVGPRIGVGIFIGGALGWKGITELATRGGVEAANLGNWVLWTAIAILTLPSFASILFTYVFRTPASVPPGFAPGKTRWPVPGGRNTLYAALGLIGTAGIAVTAQMLFGLSWVACIVTIAMAWPLCVMNGRITADTDINPVRLVAIVILSVVAAAFAGEGAIFLLAMAVVGGTLAAMAVDMMQDFRTGYLVDANPTHQTSVQLMGAAIGSLVAIPFVLLIISKLGIGPGTSLPAPGARIWSGMAKAFSATDKSDIFTGGLIISIIAISVGGSVFSFFEAWPKTKKWVPSLFGIGIGILLSPTQCNAIFIGSLLKSLIIHLGSRGKTGADREHARNQANNDTLLIGAALFAASALVSVLLIVITSLMEAGDVNLFYLATGG